jgi:hypothetical protein
MPGADARIVKRLGATALLLAGLFVLGGVPSSARSQTGCVYVNERGAVLTALTVKEIPARFRAGATCSDKQPLMVPQAHDVDLRGQERSTSFGSPLGSMEVRWPRSVERCFSKSPARAVNEAATAVKRAINSARFDSVIKSSDRKWEFLLIDQASAVSQFPMRLSVGGHPGFAVPPNRIYIVTDFVSVGCLPSPESDARLIQVLLHEMGHILEFALLNGMESDGDRKRAEGFAAWFEGYSSAFASGIIPGSVQRYYRGLITSQRDVGERSFSGSGQDYAIASLEFEAIVDRKGVSGLMSVYQTMSSERLSFYDALERKFGWDRRDLVREVLRISSS